MSNREIRRALAKARRKAGRAKQLHKNSTALLNKGFGPFARFVMMEDEDYDNMERFVWQRLKLVREGSTNDDDWACLVTALLEGYNLARVIVDDTQRDSFIREMRRGAKLYDVLRYHYQKTGEVLHENLDALQEVLIVASDLKRCGSFDRQDLLDVIENVRDNFMPLLLELFDGMPKSGIVECEQYITPKEYHAARKQNVHRARES